MPKSSEKDVNCYVAFKGDLFLVVKSYDKPATLFG